MKKKHLKQCLEEAQGHIDSLGYTLDKACRAMERTGLRPDEYGGSRDLGDCIDKLWEEVLDTRDELNTAKENVECVHCGEMLEDTKEDLNHWEHCEDHPARKRIEKLKACLEGE
ncbi:MAG: hypothetical protein ACXABY_01330 [Candidatus Thorarchaeota archaeon]|jgi:hypothetical protein